MTDQFSFSPEEKLKLKLPKLPSINILPNPSLTININRR